MPQKQNAFQHVTHQAPGSILFISLSHSRYISYLDLRHSGYLKKTAMRMRRKSPAINISYFISCVQICMRAIESGQS